ncbi:MAG: CARDB domain-containing protein, partial [Dehalococcoidia bacterium]|nr:CARDB domain-containing protein [Dehalococcoidia bacterium]
IVEAVTKDGKRAEWSNYSSTGSVAAPGVDVTIDTTGVRGMPSNLPVGTLQCNGTSFAAPIVAALMDETRKAAPGKSAGELWKSFEDVTKRQVPSDWDKSGLRGRLVSDVTGAAVSPPPPAPAPAPVPSVGPAPPPAPRPVDLTVLPVTFSPSSAKAGDSISVSFTVKNQGGTASGPFSNRISLAASIYGTTTSLGNFSMPSLAAGASQPNTVSVTVPTAMSPGSYWVTVFADGLQAVSESDENNNIGSSDPGRITVTATPKYNYYSGAVLMNLQYRSVDGSRSKTASVSVNATFSNFKVQVAGPSTYFTQDALKSSGTYQYTCKDDVSGNVATTTAQGTIGSVNPTIISLREAPKGDTLPVSINTRYSMKETGADRKLHTGAGWSRYNDCDYQVGEADRQAGSAFGDLSSPQLTRTGMWNTSTRFSPADGGYLFTHQPKISGDTINFTGQIADPKFTYDYSGTLSLKLDRTE